MTLGDIFGLMKAILVDLEVWSWITLTIQAILVITVTQYAIRMWRG